MDTSIVPITKARGILGNLTSQVAGDRYIVLTKGGEPKAALVDIKYLARLEKTVAKVYQKTFIDPKLLPFTREFSDKEIQTWQEEDQL